LLRFFRRRDKSNIEPTVAKTNSFDGNNADILLNDIRDEFGLDYTKQRDITLKKVERFALKNSIYSFIELEKKLKMDSHLKQSFINLLTVGETYFYRESALFDLLCDTVNDNRDFKILCAPSSSGEEAYSIGIYLKEHCKGSQDINIVGIDINSESIKRAKEGIYTKRSLSYLPDNLKIKYFEQIGDKYRITNEIKTLTDFRVQNIFDSSLFTYGKFDIIFCRNMLIYFNEQKKRETLEILRKLLKRDGKLFLGHADIAFMPEGYKKVSKNRGSYFVRDRM